MNEEDEIIWAEGSLRIPLTYAPSHVNCTDKYVYVDGHLMSDDASQLGLRPVGELSETTCSHRIRKRIRRGIVWQVAYGAQLTHPEGLAASPQSSNHSEDVILSSSPMTPYTH